MLLVKCTLDTTNCQSNLRYFGYENIQYSIESSRDQCSYLNYSYKWSADTYDFYPHWRFNTFAYNGNYGKFHNFNYESDCHFYYPFTTKEGINELDSWYSTYYMGRIDSMQVNSKKYYNIVYFRVPTDKSFPYPNEDMGDDGYSLYYWAKDVGLIRIKHQSFKYVNSNQTEIFMYWDLIDSHIIK